MQYWEAMTEKFGFDDGASIPFGAMVFREAYLRVVNALAEQYGSDYRMVAFNRSGCHNPVMVVPVALQDYDLLPETDRLTGLEGNIPGDGTGEDAAMIRAVDEAMELGVDEFVEQVAVLRRKDLTKAIRRLKKGSAE